MILLTGWACTPEGSHRFADHTWRYADSLKVVRAVSDTAQAYKLSLALNVSDNYRYGNLFIQFRMQGPDSMQQTSLTQFILTDSAGNWLADRSLRGNYHFETVLNPRVKFSKPGEYVFWLKQYMRTDTLLGVEALHFDVVPLED